MRPSLEVRRQIQETICSSVLQAIDGAPINLRAPVFVRIDVRLTFSTGVDPIARAEIMVLELREPEFVLAK